MTTSIWIILVFRLSSGAAIFGWALSLAMIRDTAPAQEAASKLGHVSMAAAVAPVLGPMFGGGAG